MGKVSLERSRMLKVIRKIKFNVVWMELYCYGFEIKVL